MLTKLVLNLINPSGRNNKKFDYKPSNIPSFMMNSDEYHMEVLKSLLPVKSNKIQNDWLPVGQS